MYRISAVVKMHGICPLLTLAVALVGWSPVALSQQPASNSFVIEHVTIIDVRTGTHSPDQTVTITGHRIASVGPSAMVSTPSGIRVVDGTGKFLMPGLWDMHVHPLFNGHERALPQLVANGITGIRDMASRFGDIPDAREAAARGDLVMPRMLISGPGLDGIPPNIPGAPDGVLLVITSPEAGREIVSRLAAAKVDHVKVRNALTRETYFAIAEEAKRQGLSFTGHLPPDVDILEASNAGQNPIEHLRGLGAKCARDPSSLAGGATGPIEIDRERCRQTARLLVRNGTWLTPTIGGPGRGDARLRRFNGEITLMAAREGVRLLAGTDWPGVGFGAADERLLHNELAGLVEAGLSPLEALQIAILNPAIFLDRTHDLASVEAGKLADLLLLDADPLVDIENTRRIWAVVVNGRLIESETRQRILDEERELRTREQ